MSFSPANLPSRLTRLAPVALAVVLGLAGGWIGLTLGGTVHHEVGPLDTSMRVEPRWGGGTSIDIPPLGQLDLATHDGPLGLQATLEGVDQVEARALVTHPDRLAGLKPQAERDLRWEVEMAVLRAAVATLLGAMALSALALRRIRSALVGGASAGLALAVSLGVSAASWNPTALAEPRYTGLLTSAPSVVGSAESIVSNFSVYGDQLARIVQNVGGLYAATSTLPLLPPENDSVRVLHISDLHLAPQAWDLVRTVVRQYKVDVVVDSGDITDHGTAAENRYVQEIRHITAAGVPYVWVRGNHDSATTERAMRAIPGVHVLEGRVQKVAGLSFLGAGDPSFTPDKTTADPDVDAEAIQQAAQSLATTAEAVGGVDVAVFHDPAAEQALDGHAGMALFGHLHYRKVTRGSQGTWEMIQGSTGGSGLRALEPKKPANIEMSVLYVDRSSGALQAYDDITLGGLGLASAEITRHVVDAPGADRQLVAPRTPAGPE
ncbi:MAG: metallophosphoesterase family protein [Nocardioides sp.]